jgi:hypothetical protein
MKRKWMLALAVVIALLLPTASLAANGYPDPGTSVTNIVVQNTSPTLSDPTGATASIQVEYYDTSGNLDYTRAPFNLDAKSVAEIKTQDETVLGDGWQGSAVMSSDQSIAAIVSVKNTEVSGAPDKNTQGAYNGALEGANTLYFPSVYGFQYIVSRLSVQNTESSSADVYLNFYDRDGNSLGTKEASIAGFSQRTFYLGDTGDLPNGWPSDFLDGSVTVTSTNKLAGAAVTTWGNRSASYQALTDNNKGNTLYAPSLFRYSYGVDSGGVAPGDFDPLSDKFTLFSAINVQNTSSTDPANITVKFYSRGDTSGVPVMTLTHQIPAQSAVGMNFKNGGDLDWDEFEDLQKAGPYDWDGSVTVESDQPVVGVGITNWENAGKAGVYAMVTPNDGAPALFVPAQYRLDWGSGWAQWSAINLQNVGGGSISKADLTIEYIDTNGNTVDTFTGNDLPSDLGVGAALGLNTRNGGDLDASEFAGFPDDGGLPRYIGGIYVTAPAGSKLVGVANIIYNNRASVYNAFPGQ